jgi:hypothetical protein
LPVIVVSREKPNMRDILKAIKHLPGWPRRWSLIKGAGKIYSIDIKRRGGPIYIQPTGIRRKDAERVVRLSSLRSLVPEPIRVAHLIATAIVRGESHGRV